MTTLVTGGSGFLGRHVLHALAASSSRVVALGRHLPPGWPATDFVRADLDDFDGLRRAIATISPDVVIHAAGKTPPAPSSALYLANARATMHLLNALRDAGRPCRFVHAGSAAELGAVPVEQLPANEDQPCRPTDAYGLSKWAASRIALAAPPPLEVIVARLFNPIGPGMPTSQAFGRFASILAEPGPKSLTMTVGDLDARRDFLDVRDAAEALVALIDRGRAGSIYHVGTGVSRSVGEGLAELIRLSGRDARIERTPSRRGPNDSRADITRIFDHTGWSPRVSWERSLADLWEAAVRGRPARKVA
jgi:nucleoside-diphosphate-sugar epimerase